MSDIVSDREGDEPSEIERDYLRKQIAIYEWLTARASAQAPSETEDGAEIVFLDHSGEQHRIVYDIREDHPGLGSGWFLHEDDAFQTNQPKLEGQNRILADRMWRTPEKRKQFETETGLSDELTEEYQTRFVRWALAALSVPSAHCETRNSEVLASFVEYCRAHPSERFWQALRNWSGRSFILASAPNNSLLPTTLAQGDVDDTFNWEGKDK